MSEGAGRLVPFGDWVYPRRWRRGDLMLTVLDSRPRTLLCLEQTLNATSTRMDVTGVSEFSLVPVAAITRRTGSRFPRVPGTLSGDQARKLLRAVQDAAAASPSAWVEIEGKRQLSSSRHRSSGLQAAVLQKSGGVCAGCRVNYAELFGVAGLMSMEVHHLDELKHAQTELVRTGADRLVALCGSCHNLTDAGLSLAQIRRTWRSRARRAASPVASNARSKVGKK